MSDVDVRAPDTARPRGTPTGLTTTAADLARRWWERLGPTTKAAIRPLGIYLASRAAVTLAVGVVVMLNVGLASRQFQSVFWPTIPAGRPIFRALGIWDAGWYLQIAGHGYGSALHAILAFFPLLPIVIRAVVFITGLNTLYAGILATFLIGAMASVGIWFLVRRLSGVSTADRATALWCFFPGAMTLTLVYSEGLIALLAVICLFALLRRRWVLAGIAAALAGATAPEGLALTVSCAWAAGACLLQRPAEAVPGGTGASGVLGHREWRSLIAPLLAPLGWLAYQAYLWRTTGDLTAWWYVEKRGFSNGFDPWKATGDKVRLALAHPTVPDYLVPTLGLLVLAAAAILLWRWKPPAVVTIYAAVAMAAPLTAAVVGARPRFFIAAFPFVVALARPFRGATFYAILGTSAVCLGLLTIILVADVDLVRMFTP